MLGATQNLCIEHKKTLKRTSPFGLPIKLRIALSQDLKDIVWESLAYMDLVTKTKQKQLSSINFLIIQGILD